MTTPDGIRWYQTDKIPFRDSNGVIQGVIGFSVDITERTHLEQKLKLERDRALQYFEIQSSIMVVLNVDQTVKFINQSGCNILGYTVQEVVGQNWFDRFIPEAIREAVRSKFGEIVSGKIETVTYFENSIRTRSGEERFMIWRSALITDDSGKISGTVSSGIDMTEQKKMQKALDEEGEKFRTIFDQTNQFLGLLSPEGVLLEINRAALELIGQTADEVLGKPFWETGWWTHSKEIQDKLREAVLNAAQGNEAGFEVNHVSSTGEIHLFDFSLTPIRDNEGKVIFLLPTGWDLTEQRKAKDLLQRSEDAYRMAFQKASAGIVWADAVTGKIIDCNEAVQRLTERTLDEMRGQSFTVLHPPEIHEDISWIFFHRMLHERSIEKECLLLSKSGKRVPVDLHIMEIMLGNCHVYQATFRDLTAVKLNEKHLFKEMARNVALLRLAQMHELPLGEISKYTMEAAIEITGSKIGYIAFANEDESVLTMHYWSKNAMAQCSMMDKPIIYPVKDTGLWGEAIRQRRAVITNDYEQAPGKKGTPEGYVPLKRHMNIPVFDGKKIVAVAGIGNKDTDYDDDDVMQLTLMMEGMMGLIHRKRAEEALAESAEKLKNLIESTSDIIWEIDQEGKYTYVSPVIEKFSGWTAEEVVGKRLDEFFSPELREAMWDKCLMMTKDKKSFDHFENTFMGKNGKKVLFDTRGVPFYDRQGKWKGYRGVSRDVTETRNREDQLRQSQKFEALSTLAGGIAHDFNNMLFIISANLRLCERSAPPDSPIHEKLNEIKMACVRGKNLTEQILVYSRRSDKKFQLLDLKEIVLETVKFLRATIPTTIDMRSEIAHNCGRAWGDSTELQQILMNLGTNAMHAIGDKMGLIQINLAMEYVSEPKRDAYPEIPVGRYVVLSVQDSGSGMDEEVLKHIFEPYFTTKEVGKGTGLGLSIAHSIVVSMNGAIRIQSAIGKGTTFFVYLPEAGQKM